jgi:hypothetical protein
MAVKSGVVIPRPAIGKERKKPKRTIIGTKDTPVAEAVKITYQGKGLLDALN